MIMEKMQKRETQGLLFTLPEKAKKQLGGIPLLDRIVKGNPLEILRKYGLDFDGRIKLSADEANKVSETELRHWFWSLQRNEDIRMAIRFCSLLLKKRAAREFLYSMDLSPEFGNEAAKALGKNRETEG